MPDRRAAALAGLAAYQEAQRDPPSAPASVVATAGRATLRERGGDGPPVVLVPSLINPPAILDLAPRSLATWLASEGFRVLLVDWGNPAPEDRALDVAGHVSRRLLPLIATLDRAPALVGYCLGGTMALAAAALAPVAALATIAAPWRFAGYGTGARADMVALWDRAKPACDALGLVPMEVLQTGFWRLDPARTIAKFEAFGRMAAASEAARGFVRLEDWANAGAPLTYAAGADLFETFARDDAPGGGAWTVAGRTVDPASLACPAIEFVSTTDRIVPAAAAAGLPERREIALGHVGMVVGGRGEEALWRPLADWLRGA